MLAMSSHTIVFQELCGGKTEISRQVSKYKGVGVSEIMMGVLLGVNRRIEGYDYQYRLSQQICYNLAHTNALSGYIY